MLLEADRRTLLRIAHEAIVAHVCGGVVLMPEIDGALSQLADAFVTLRRGGELRGCIGRLQASQPVARVVAHCAVAACRDDPRFPPVTGEELDGLEIELSILGPIELVANLEDIELGRHGLLVERGFRRGLLLPQVATEWKWDRKRFVEETCRKAGLPRDAWQAGATVSKFEAEVFG
jgi:AmmeMemoRadiSam system protein A